MRSLNTNSPDILNLHKSKEFKQKNVYIVGIIINMFNGLPKMQNVKSVKK